jgi:hypothetical protein
MHIHRIALAAAAAAAVLAVVGARLAADPSAPAAPAARAVVVSAGPHVERSARGGGWTAARAGDALGPADAIRTGRGDTAEVCLGRGTTLVIDGRSELTVREIDAVAQKIQLVRGRIGVDHRPDGVRVVRVEDASGTILASSAGGRWSAVASHDTLAVSAVEGAVHLESAGAAVDVGAGTQSAAWRGAAPLAPRPVSAAVLLRVAHALVELRRDACARLQVDVASEVEVNGDRVPVGRDGRVLVRVSGQRRRDPVEVVVRHVTGAVERRRVRCVEEAAEVKALEVRWDAR